MKTASVSPSATCPEDLHLRHPVLVIWVALRLRSANLACLQLDKLVDTLHVAIQFENLDAYAICQTLECWI